MRHVRLRSLTLLAALAVAFGAAVPIGSGQAQQEASPTYSARTCGLGEPAFCDTFDQPYTREARSGRLDPELWSVARITGKNNAGQGYVNQFIPTQAMRCRDPISGLLPPNDYFFCGPEFGESMHFMDAFDDGGDYVYNSARIRQPFDFTSRTGTVVWDVDAKTSGSHGWWLELWITDEPLPAPHHNIIDTPLPRHGVALDFSNMCNSAVQPGDAGAAMGSLMNVEVVRNYVSSGEIVPWQGAGGATMQHRDCYTTGPDMFNHFKLLINQQRLELWASDAQAHPHTGAATPSKLIATVENLNLSFTSGFVHFQHAQYNAAKAVGGVSTTSHQTYHWDNIGFDGPVLPVPAQYTIPDALVRTGTGINLGYLGTNEGLQSGPLTFSNVNLSGATSAALTFNANFPGSSINYRLNGGAWQSWSAPHTGNWAAAVVPLNMAELRSGTNTVDFAAAGGGQAYVANIDLLLTDAASPGGAAPSGVTVAEPVAPSLDIAPASPEENP